MGWLVLENYSRFKQSASKELSLCLLSDAVNDKSVGIATSEAVANERILMGQRSAIKIIDDL